MKKEESHGKISRFQKHLHILDLEKAHAEPKQLEQEKLLMDQLNPKPLNLPKDKEIFINFLEKWLFSKPTWAMFTAACGIIFIIYQNVWEKEPGIRSKGKTQIQVYYEYNQVVKTFDPKVSLPDGSKVQVEITAAQDSVAYINVVDKNAAPLLSKEFILKQAIKLKLGQKNRFADSLQLTGTNEGEILGIMVCEAKNIADIEAWNTKLDAFFIFSKSVTEGCEVFKFKLR
ncbi:MAG: hypothetical protein AB8G05_13570 [Oligoflexales bacterium]